MLCGCSAAFTAVSIAGVCHKVDKTLRFMRSQRVAYRAYLVCVPARALRILAKETFRFGRCLGAPINLDRLSPSLLAGAVRREKFAR